MPARSGSAPKRRLSASDVARVVSQDHTKLGGAAIAYLRAADARLAELDVPAPLASPTGRRLPAVVDELDALIRQHIDAVESKA